jgi:hypothetical protein
MDERSLDKLKILLTGIETDASRDVMRLLASDGAIVTAADTDQTQLDRLERDAGLYRTTVDTARVELYNLSEVRLWEGLDSALERPRLALRRAKASAARGRRQTARRRSPSGS